MIIEKSASAVQALLALPLLASLEPLYPDFQHWYVNTVVPGIALGGDILLIAREGSNVQAIALGKKSGGETKLRCVRVAPARQNAGLGLRLIDRMLEELECSKPHCTVAEELFHAYARPFVNRYGFELSHVAKGAYRPGKLEYAFNGEAPEPEAWTAPGG